MPSEAGDDPVRTRASTQAGLEEEWAGVFDLTGGVVAAAAYEEATNPGDGSFNFGGSG